MPNFHPILIHFPIALALVILACDLIGNFMKKSNFISTGTILSVFALLGAIAAVITGLLAEDSANLPDQAENMLDIHETMAFIFLGVMALMVAVRLALGNRLQSRRSWLVLILSLIAAGVVSAGGYFGGEMVFRYGAGVRTAAQGTAWPGNTIEDHHTGNQDDSKDR